MSKPMLLAAALLLAGCSKSATAPEQQGPTKVDQPSVATAAAPAPAATRDRTPAHAEASAADSAAAAKLALDGEGLRIIAVPSGSTQLIAFGTAKPDALKALQAVEGAPSSEGENVDCGATNVIWPDGLAAWFARGKFVGWSVAKAGSNLSTMGGLRLGATRAEVENGATVAKIAPSSLGEEFTAGDIGGLLDSRRADAKVTNLWAGSVCIAR